MPEEKRHYVYTLAYPESMGGQVFYVGCGTGTRINEHEGEAKYHCKCKKCGVIRGIWETGEQVVKKKVAFFDMRVKGLLHEHDLIVLLKSEGHPLTNIKSGDVWRASADPTCTEEQLQKIEDEWEAMLRRRAEASKRYYARLREEKRLRSLTSKRDKS
jgi:hypothetical protein